MRITVFNGSPRKDKGNTHFMAEEFLKGAKEAGAQAENIFLADKEIHYCGGCFYCWTKNPGECFFKDDMKELLLRVIKTDICVFATPVHTDNITGIMQLFLSKFIPIIAPYFERDEKGETRHKKRFEKYPKIVVISNCGFPERSHFEVLKLFFKRFARNFHSEVIGEIYLSGGEILKQKNKNSKLEFIIDNYKKLLRRVGREVVLNFKISPETMKKLEKPIVDYETYIENGNKMWNYLLSENKNYI